MKTYEIDGERFSSLEEFYSEIDRVMQLSSWGHNLDAFNDVLRGGFGTPNGGFAICWKNHELSREWLGLEFNRLLEIIRTHGPGGREEEDRVTLILD